MKKDPAEVKVYTKAMVDSNCARDAYVDKEQDKFFCWINRQRADIDTLKERCRVRSRCWLICWINLKPLV